MIPFSVNILDDFRLNVLLEISAMIDFKHGAAAVRLFEPNIPWNEKFLRYRLRCYEEMLDPIAGQANKDLNAFLNDAPLPFSKTLPPVSGVPEGKL